MNNTIKTIAIVLGLSFANLLQAQEAGVSTIDKPDYLAKIISVPNTNTMKVYIGNKVSQKLWFNLTDDFGNVLFTKLIQKNEPQAYLKLNMDELPDGVYHFELGAKIGKTVKSFRKEPSYAVTKPVGSLVAVN
ncbi:MAG: hypothetical protein V4683_16425 [Bacteroidota bacterium]